MLAAQVYKTLRDCPKTNMTKTQKNEEKSEQTRTSSNPLRDHKA